MIGEFVRAVLSTKNDKVVFRDICPACDDFRAHRIGGKPGEALGICLSCGGETPCLIRRIDKTNADRARLFMDRWKKASRRKVSPSKQAKSKTYGTEARRKAAASAFSDLPLRTVKCSFCKKTFKTKHPKKINCSRACTVSKAGQKRAQKRRERVSPGRDRPTAPEPVTKKQAAAGTLSELPFAKGASYGSHKLEEDCTNKDAELPWLLSCLQCGSLSYTKGRNVIARQIPLCTCQKSQA